MESYFSYKFFATVGAVSGDSADMELTAAMGTFNILIMINTGGYTDAKSKKHNNNK